MNSKILSNSAPKVRAAKTRCKIAKIWQKHPIKEVLYVGTIKKDDAIIGTYYIAYISEKTAMEWDLYPDWNNRQTMTNKPCLFCQELNETGLKILMPVGDWSLAPIEKYLDKDTVNKIYNAVALMRPIFICETDKDNLD